MFRTLESWADTPDMTAECPILIPFVGLAQLTRNPTNLGLGEMGVGQVGWDILPTIGSIMFIENYTLWVCSTVRLTGNSLGLQH